MAPDPESDEQQRSDDPAAAPGELIRGTVYTAVTEGYDKKPLRFHADHGVERDVRTSELTGRAGILWNREEKLVKPPKIGLWSVYCDGSITPRSNLLAAVESWLEKADVALFKHPHRTCAYAEIDACVARKKITEQEGEQARGTLMLSGFPKDYGLWALGMIARRVHANALQQFAFPMCWEMVNHIPRDQIWFPFVMWKLKHSEKRIHTIDEDIFNNGFFQFRRHGT